jgi:predicted MPP superfamily phosphohydrolase
MIGVWVLGGVAAFGHLVIWVAIYNRLHATSVRRDLKKRLEKCIYAAVLAGGILGLVRWIEFSLSRDSFGFLIGTERLGGLLLTFYVLVCWLAAVAVVLRWLVWRVSLRRPATVKVQRLDWIRLGEVRNLDDRGASAPEGYGESRGVPSATQPHGRWCGDRLTQRLARIPGNQILHLEVNEKEISIPDLPEALRGLTIAHASDFHLTGQMTQDFYHYVVGKINDLQCDLIALTGDLIDRPTCLPWLEPVFGKLSAPLGKYYVLGNHDCRIEDESVLRASLERSGLKALNGRWETVEYRGSRLALAGNELPWYPGANHLGNSKEGVAEYKNALKVLLSHSPDQIDWACERGFHLMLAGHTHGGQIRPPVIGPIVSPSRYGPKFASGEFVVGGTHLHVSRGIAGTHPLRWNCPPEITRLKLT